MKFPLILASTSPRRKNLLQNFGVPFDVIPSGVDESIVDITLEPLVYAQQLSYLKAKDVFDKLNFQSTVIGADTIVVFEGKILNKPENLTDAQNMLELLSGKTHTVITGVSILFPNVVKTFYEETFVTFYPLLNENIDKYVQTRKTLDKAGGYGIQDDYGSTFVQKIDGCYTNVVGLPLGRVHQELTTLGLL